MFNTIATSRELDHSRQYFEIVIITFSPFIRIDSASDLTPWCRKIFARAEANGSGYFVNYNDIGMVTRRVHQLSPIIIVRVNDDGVYGNAASPMGAASAFLPGAFGPLPRAFHPANQFATSPTGIARVGLTMTAIQGMVDTSRRRRKV